MKKIKIRNSDKITTSEMIIIAIWTLTIAMFFIIL